MLNEGEIFKEHMERNKYKNSREPRESGEGKLILENEIQSDSKESIPKGHISRLEHVNKGIY